jgi:AcrR family transcriptional regulator
METISKKQLALLQAGRKLFWEYGITKLSIREICLEANVSRMTFYNYFGDKARFVIAVIDWYIDHSVLEYRKWMDSAGSFSKKLEKLIRMKPEGFNELSPELILDLQDPENSGILEYYRKRSEELKSMMKEDIKQAMDSGELRSDVNPEFILYFLDRMNEMLKEEELKALYDNTQQMVSEMTNCFFHGVLLHFPKGKIKRELD